VDWLHAMGGSEMTLDNTSWRLEAFEGGTDPIPSPQDLQDVEVTLNFAVSTGAVTQISGGSGCNRYASQAEVRGDTITLSPIAGTRMMCEPARMAVEDAYLKALGTAQGYEMQGDQLLIIHADGQLRFAPAT